jgi:hypothetical protein
VIVVLPHDTIGRILDQASTAPGALSENISGALNKAKKDKANLVGPLEANELNALSAWCRSVGLTKEAETVEAAVRASG